MLVPGEFLTMPVPQEQPPAPPTDRSCAKSTPPPPAPVVKTDDPEERSFLQNLLSALGAIHT
jgi:hypothetical protein